MALDRTDPGPRHAIRTSTRKGAFLLPAILLRTRFFQTPNTTEDLQGERAMSIAAETEP